MRLLLDRTETGSDGTFGRLTLLNSAGAAVLVLPTMEEDWRDNRPRVSCIPAGTYELRRTIYYKRGIETFEVTGVPGRSRILFHPANTEEDVEGCIGLGLRFGQLWIARDEDTGAAGYKKAVVGSQEAFRLLMRNLAGVDRADLSITWAIAGIT